MRRRQFLGTVTSGVIAGTVGADRPQALAAAQLTPPVRTPMVLMAPRADGVDAIWAVSRLCTGRVEWEAADGRRGTAAIDPYGFVPQSDDVLRVRVSGLAPGGTYRLRAVTRAAGDTHETPSAWKTFRTLNPAAETTTFVVWNDTHKPDTHPSFAGRVAFDALRREQAAWLAETIRQPGFRDAPYRVVFCHIPPRWLDESPQDYAGKGFDRLVGGGPRLQGAHMDRRHRRCQPAGSTRERPRGHGTRDHLAGAGDLIRAFGPRSRPARLPPPGSRT